MRRFVLGSVGLSIAMVGATDTRAEAIRWHFSEGRAMQVARTAGKPVMVDLFATRSLWGARMVTDTYVDQEVVKYASRFEALRLDLAAEGVALAKRLGIQRSSILFLTPEGKLVHRIRGFHTPRMFMIEMKKAYGSYRDAPLYAKRAANPKDFEAAIRMATIRARAHDPKAATSHLARAERLRVPHKGPLYSEAYFAMGDYYQLANRLSEALACFRKARAASRSVDDLAYAQISIGSCHLVQRDFAKAKLELDKVLTLKGAHEEDKDVARQLMPSSQPPVSRR